MTKPEGHSPLGASGTHRWMPCPGSVGLSEGIEDPESEHAAIGTAAHKLGEVCLTLDQDAWEFIGITYGNGLGDPQPPEKWVTIDADMANAVQEYLDAVRAWHPNRNQGNTWIERDFHCPQIHPLFYGTSDLVHLESIATGVVEQGHIEEQHVLHIWDYKNGAGIVVEVENNPQLKYYAIGALEDLNLWEVVHKVVFHVAQPNGFHWDGPIRHWEATPAELEDWLIDTLIPAMNYAQASRDTHSGEHCRFCPTRRHACPQLEKDMSELEAMMAAMDKAGGAPKMTNEWMGRFLELFELAKIKAKATNEETFNRLNAGHKVPGWKLAKARAHRVWKEGVEDLAKTTFGTSAYIPAKLKSPAQIEALPKGSAFAAEHAFKPDAGLTVVKADDNRPAVSKEVKSMFVDQSKKKVKA